MSILIFKLANLKLFQFGVFVYFLFVCFVQNLKVTKYILNKSTFLNEVTIKMCESSK